MSSEKPTDIYTGPLPSDRSKADVEEPKTPVKPSPPRPLWLAPTILLLAGIASSALGELLFPLLNLDTKFLPFLIQEALEAVFGVATLLLIIHVVHFALEWAINVLIAHKKEKERYQKELVTYHQEMEEYLQKVDQAYTDSVT